MRFMVMHKNDPHTEAGEPPPMEIVQQMGAFIGEHAQTGKFLFGAGLSGSSTRTRLVFRDGQYTTTQINGKAYPSVREMVIAHALGAQGVVSSICPIHMTEQTPGDPLYGYRPAVDALYQRIAASLP